MVECPSCGGEMQRMPLVVFCLRCCFFIDVPPQQTVARLVEAAAS